MTDIVLQNVPFCWCFISSSAHGGHIQSQLLYVLPCKSFITVNNTVLREFFGNPIGVSVVEQCSYMIVLTDEQCRDILLKFCDVEISLEKL